MPTEIQCSSNVAKPISMSSTVGATRNQLTETVATDEWAQPPWGRIWATVAVEFDPNVPICSMDRLANSHQPIRSSLKKKRPWASLELELVIQSRPGF